MKKLLFILLFFVSQQFSYAVDLLSIKLEKNEKLESTYSSKFSNSQTFHFIITKNSDTKKYALKPYLLEGNSKIKQLKEVLFDDIPNIIASHSAGNSLVLSNYIEKDKTLFVVNFDTKTGENNLKTITKVEKPDLIFSISGKTVIVNYIKKGEKLELKTIADSENITNTSIETPQDYLKEFKTIIKDFPDAINQNEFVKNGSIKDSRVYLIDDKMIFTNQKNNELNLFSIDLKNKNSYRKSSFDLGFDKKIKDINTYILDNNLIASGSNKDDLNLKIFDLENGKELKQFSLQNDLKSYFENDAFENFMKEAKKSSLKTTATLNATKNNKLKVRLDRVNEQTYNYNYNWWWFQHWMMQQQQQQMMMQQQMMRTMPRGGGFGPNNYYDILIEKSFAGKEVKYQSLEFVLNNDFTIDKASNEETLFKNHDKDEVLKEYEDNKNVKEFSCVFLDEELHYIYQDKKSKVIYIDFKSL